MKKLNKQAKNLLLFFATFLCITPLTYALSQQSNSDTTIRLKILGINDFHGQISAGRFEKNEPVGGAAVFAAYLKQAQKGMEDKTIIAIMGDQVGASPPASALLHDEPTILFTNSLGNEYCDIKDRMNPNCNIVATLGNHEFDKGQQALFDLIYGTTNPPTDYWYPLPYYPGATYPYISANIIDAKTENPIFPPYTIKLVHGIRIAFIGAITKDAANLIFPAHVKDIKFIDEAKSINHYIPELKRQGAEIIIVLIHEGGAQTPYEGETQPDLPVSGAINDIIYQLNDGIDVVMAGHTHQFLNAYLPNHNGRKILVTQANSYSSSFAEVTLDVDLQEHKIHQKSAKIISAYANRLPGTMPDEQAQNLVTLAENKTAPLINETLGITEHPLLRAQNIDGESNLGNFIADGLKTVMNTDIGLSNIHGMRDDLAAGTITKGNIYTVLPFSNTIVTMSLTGQDIFDLLEQQWMGPYDNILQISGFTYTYDPSKPIGQKIISILHKQNPLIKDKKYTIATSDFLASGSGIFSVMKRGQIIVVGELDHDVISQYIKKFPHPITASIEGRIKQAFWYPFRG